MMRETKVPPAGTPTPQPRPVEQDLDDFIFACDPPQVSDR